MSETSKVLAFEKFREKVDSPYRLVLLAARNAKDIIRDAKAQGKLLERKPIELALRQILNNMDSRQILENAPDAPKMKEKAAEDENDMEDRELS